MPSRLYDRPIGAALAGALAISFSGILFRAAHVSPSTGAFYRCALALPVLLPLSWLEDRRFGPRPAQAARPRRAGRRLLRDRPGRLARGDRAGRRRARDRARQPAGRVRRPARLDDPRRAAVEPLAGRDPGRPVRRAADLGRVRERRLRQQPRARRRVRDPDRARLLGLPARAPREQRRLAPPGGAALRRDARLRAGHDPDRACDRRPRLDARLACLGLPAAARVELTGARLAADLDLAAAPAGCDHLRALDVPARADGAVRLGDPRRVAFAAAARRGRARARRPADRHLGNRPRRTAAEPVYAGVTQ